MYYIACCDNTGRCFGFLKKDKTVSTNPDADKGNLMAFKRKKDTNEIILQNNLSHMLLPNGSPFRCTAVKG